MTRNTVLKVINPIPAGLVTSQILTVLLGGSLPSEVFEPLHAGGGIALAAIHLILNWSWGEATYFKRTASAAK